MARYSKLSSSTFAGAPADPSTRSTDSGGTYWPTTAGRQRIQSTFAGPMPPRSSRSVANRTCSRGLPMAATATRTSCTARSKRRHTLTSRWWRDAGCRTWPPVMRSEATRPGYPFSREAGSRQAASAIRKSAAIGSVRSSASILFAIVWSA